MIPKSEVGVLKNDSTNVVKLIKTAYNVSCQLTTGKFYTHIHTYFTLFFLMFPSISHHCQMWQRLSSKVTLSHDNLPNNVRVVYKPLCGNAGSSGGSEGVCDNVKPGDQVSFIFYLLFKEKLFIFPVHSSSTVVVKTVNIALWASSEYGWHSQFSRLNLWCHFFRHENSWSWVRLE